MKITHLESRPIFDSRGRPTLETTVFAEGLSATASVPSGKSIGSHEAKELRDKDSGVGPAILSVTGEIARECYARDFSSADEVDRFLVSLDGTADKSRLGANAILSVSIAVQRLFAQAARQPLWAAIAARGGFVASAPRLFVNMLNGGVHARFRLPFQEYLLVVPGEPHEAFARAQGAFTELGDRLGDVPMGDEGGFSPSFPALDEPFNVLAGIAARYPGTMLALDAAATELADGERYTLLGKTYSGSELLSFYADLARRYPIQSIEDPFAEDAHDSFADLTALLGDTLIVIGDDLTVTNPARIADCAKHKEINGVLIKPNQVGTVSEAIEAVRTTYAAGWRAVCSHRSGETLDSFIADFAYGVGAFGIKAGGLGQKERLAKYERLVEIEGEAHAALTR